MNFGPMEMLMFVALLMVLIGLPIGLAVLIIYRVSSRRRAGK